MGWGGRWEGGSGWGIRVNPWLIHVNVWQKPLQYCKVISLQLIKINGKSKKIKKQNKNTELEKENRIMVARGWRWEEWGDASQRVQTFSYKMSKFHGSNVQCGGCS